MVPSSIYKLRRPRPLRPVEIVGGLKIHPELRRGSQYLGKIERRLDKFILTDHSANGTYVTIEGDREIVLRREEFTLRGHGWIAFGQPRATSTDVIEFFCE